MVMRLPISLEFLGFIIVQIDDGYFGVAGKTWISNNQKILRYLTGLLTQRSRIKVLDVELCLFSVLNNFY